jgi:Zn-dependent protease/predicted transcriptional regulator
MKWSLKLGRLWGIDVYLHFTFILFLAWLGSSAWAGDGMAAAFSMVTLIVALFACVLLHEYGHALTARKFGIGTHDITLLPIGGVARLERMPSDPKQELLVAIAGPAVNVAIAVVIGLILLIKGRPMPSDLLDFSQGDLLHQLLRMNLAMIGFNLLPAFPMDGGRVLRAALAMKLPYAKATRVAATIGQGMAFLFAAYALMTRQYSLLVIAIFVWYGASNEAADAEEDALMAGLKVRDAMLTDYRRLALDDSAQTVVQLILQGWQADFPVVQGGALMGVVTRQDVVAALESGEFSRPVSSFMRQTTVHCGPEDALDHSLERLRGSSLPILPVLLEGRLAGLLTTENVLEAIMFRRALNRKLPPPLSA